MIVLVTPTWHTQALYLVLLEVCCRQPILLPPLNNLLLSRKPTVTPSSPAGPPAVSGLEGYSQTLLTNGMSKKTADLLRSHSWRRGTEAAYNSAWKQWSSWCGQRKIDPVCSSLASIADYLTEFLNQGKSYRTINNHRSAISAFQTPIDGTKVGQRGLICKDNLPSRGEKDRVSSNRISTIFFKGDPFLCAYSTITYS